MNDKKAIIITILFIILMGGLLIFLSINKNKDNNKDKEGDTIITIGIESKIDDSTPILYDFYNSMMGLKSDNNYIELGNSILAVDNKEHRMYFQNYLNTADSPINSGFSEFLVNDDQFFKILEIVKNYNKIDEKDFSFYFMGSSNNEIDKFLTDEKINSNKYDLFYNIETNGYPLKYMKLYESYFKYLVDLNDKKWESFNYKQTIKQEKDNHIIEIKVNAYDYTITDRNANVSFNVNTIDEVNKYLYDKGFQRIGG